MITTTTETAWSEQFPRSFGDWYWSRGWQDTADIEAVMVGENVAGFPLIYRVGEDSGYAQGHCRDLGVEFLGPITPDSHAALVAENADLKLALLEIGRELDPETSDVPLIDQVIDLKNRYADLSASVENLAEIIFHNKNCTALVAENAVLRKAVAEALAYIKADPTLDDEGVTVLAQLAAALVSLNQNNDSTQATHSTTGDVNA